MEKKYATIKKDWFRYQSMKRIEKMSDSMLERYLQRGETLLKANIRQFEKPQKQFGGKTGVEAGWGGHVENMKYVLEQPANTLQEKQEKLRLISNQMKLEYYSPTQARDKMREYAGGQEYETWNGVIRESFYGENADQLTYTERKEILEKTRAVFAKFSPDEIEIIGSGNILAAAIRFRSMGLDYREMVRRSVISVKNAYNYRKDHDMLKSKSQRAKSPIKIINK